MRVYTIYIKSLVASVCILHNYHGIDDPDADDDDEDVHNKH